MRKAVWIVGLVVVVAAAVWWFRRGGGDDGRTYRFATVERGDLESVVSATGTLDAVTTVQVGTQVSGIIAETLVDFNDHVEAGQVIARIDTTLLSIAVRDAEASGERAEAELRQNEREFARISSLFERNLASEADFNLAQYNLDVARAGEKSAAINLERARQNLGYATITTPISGTVIERNVEPGQTVAASFSAPQLFLIANDLSRMQILASVDESDIGRIAVGQAVRFTVQAYPDETFTGTVRQVRMQSTVTENVVNYTVVIDVANPDGRLLPGMTATVEFLIETAKDVLKVANAALRFRGTPEMLAELRSRREAARAGAPDSARGGFAGTGGERGNGERRPPADFALLWTLGEDGTPTALRVRTGITDGQSTEIRGDDVREGMQVITGITQDGGTSSANPFQGEPRGGPPRPGGF